MKLFSAGHRSGFSPAASRLLFFVVLLITLAAGLDPKGYHFRNEVTWPAGEPGLKFGRFGRAHTKPFVSPVLAAKLNAGGFTLEAVTTLADLDNGSFRLLATFHSGDDGSQLLVGQWRQFLVVMNGDDYDHTRKFPRLTAEIPSTDSNPVLMTLTTGPEGTRLYFDGKRIAANHNLHLIIPSTPERSRLTLGASVHASNPWQGDLRGFALFPRVLRTAEIAAEYAQWKEQKGLAFVAGEKPLLLYRFAERGVTSVKCEGTLEAPLEIPTGLWALGRRALAPPAQHASGSRSGLQDSAINLFGFMPFGITLAMLLRPAVGRVRSRMLIVTLAGLSLSLIIELTQAWLPSRDSSMQDLLLNTAGTLLGATLAALFPKRGSMAAE